MIESIERTPGTTAIDTAERRARSVWQAYGEELEASPKTRATYERALKQWAAHLEGMGEEWDTVGRRAVTEWRADLIETGHSPYTVNVYLSALRSFYGWAAARRMYPDITAGIKGMRTGRAQAKDALTKAQTKRLLSYRPDGEAAKRDTAMIHLMARRGLRTVEVARADVGDLRQVAGRAVLYIRGKGYTAANDFVVLGDELSALIADYLTERGGDLEDSAPLFAGVGNRNKGGRLTTRTVARVAKERMAAAGATGPKLSAHSLRHTAVTMALLGGATVQEAQALARHADVSTTMVYAHNLDRLGAAAESAVDNYLGL